KPPVLSSSALAGEAVPLPRLPEEEQPKDTIEQVIQRRGPTRTFDKAASITLAQLSTILDYATRGLPADSLEPPGPRLNDLYLTAYAQHLGATGLTFFDDDVIEFFSPHAKDKSAIFLLAIGKPLKSKPQ